MAKVTKKPPHVLAGELLRDGLQAIIPAGWRIRSELPVRIPDYNEPEPDISLARGTAKDYANRHPGPARPGRLVVEVANRRAFRRSPDGQRLCVARRVSRCIGSSISGHAKSEVYTRLKREAWAATVSLASSNQVNPYRS